MKLSLTRDTLIWIAVAVFGVIGMILGIVAVAKPIIMGTIQATDLMKDAHYEGMITEIKNHVNMAVIGGFLALFAGLASIVGAGFGIVKGIEIESKFTWGFIFIAVVAFSLGVAAMVMNADLNDQGWFVQVAMKLGTSTHNII